MRKILAMMFVVLVGAAGVARADATTPEKNKGGKGDKVDKVGKAKAGAACKTDADCDQSSRPTRCSDSKCEPYPSHPVT